MKFGSVCSGIEAASVAFKHLGWQAAWFSEIEPFPCAVLAHHYPHVTNWGDMTLLAPMIRAGLIEAPDLLVGGTPCQAFSVAGLRQSLDDERGNLTLEFVRIANAIDSVRDTPCTILWENVPGVLSTKDNAFGAFLAGLVGEDEPLDPAGSRWPDAGMVVGPARTAAWRVLDAQFFGLAQRRRRVFIVASARKGVDPGAVLFEWDSVRRDSAPRREAREGTTRCPEVGVAFGGNNTSGPIDVAAAVNAAGGSGRMDFESETFVTHALRGEGFDASEDGTGRGTPLTVQYAYYSHDFANDRVTDPAGVNPSLTASPSASGNLNVLAFTCKDHGADAGPLSPTLRSMRHDGSHANGGWASGLAVRRLTPRECERLQGFPDDYTRIPLRAYPQRVLTAARPADRWEPLPDGTWMLMAADGPRYKAIGNSWAVPNVQWIARRLASVLSD